MPRRVDVADGSGRSSRASVTRRKGRPDIAAGITVRLRDTTTRSRANGAIARGRASRVTRDGITRLLDTRSRRRSSSNACHATADFGDLVETYLLASPADASHGTMSDTGLVLFQLFHSDGRRARGRERRAHERIVITHIPRGRDNACVARIKFEAVCTLVSPRRVTRLL